MKITHVNSGDGKKVNLSHKPVVRLAELTGSEAAASNTSSWIPSWLRFGRGGTRRRLQARQKYVRRDSTRGHR